MDAPCQLDQAKLTLVKPIGRGGFGSVSLHKYVTTEDGVQAEKLVAVKKLLDGHIQEKDLRRLQQEAKLLWNLNCEHVINMLGLLCTENEFCVVMEYASNGSCFDFFRHLRGFAHTKEQRRNVWPLKCRIANEVVEGMKFLHSRSPRKILHLDLKAANVLLDDKLHAKICDFGLSQMHTLSALSRSMSVYHQIVEKVGGTISHIAPEHLKDPNRKPTVKSDTYSFGVFVWELLCDDVPYRNALNQQALLGAMRIANKVRPSEDMIPKDAPDFLVEIMSECWEEEPDQRPTFPALVTAYKEDFEDILPHAERSTQIVLNRQHPSLATGTTLNTFHLEISSFSQDQEKSLSSRNAAQDPKSADDSDYNSKAVTSSSSPSSAAATFGLRRLMATGAFENRNSSISSRNRDEGFEDFNSEFLLQRSGRVDEECLVGASPLTTHSSHHYTRIPSSNSRLLQNGRGSVKTDGGANSRRNLWIFLCLAFVIVILAASTIVTLFFVYDRSFCFLNGSCQIKAGPVTCSQHKFMHLNPGMRVSCESNSAAGTVELCRLSCTTGFELIGDDHVTCLNGNLSTSAASCRKVVQCQGLPDLADGERTCSNEDGLFRPDDYCRFTCSEGYDLSGAQHLTCTNDGTWSDVAPLCARVPGCVVKPLVGGKLICNGFDAAQARNGTTCNIRCSDGYQLVGSPERKCLGGGAWSESTSRCFRVCEEENVPEGLEKIRCTQANLEGSLCTYRCAGRRKMAGSSERKCQTNGQWSNPYPTCKCPRCKYGLMCDKSLSFRDLSLQMKKLTDDKEPVQLTYGDRTITCESDVDVWFVNYDCTCRDSQDSRDGTCNDYLNRGQACRHAVANLLRLHVDNGLYEPPCDMGEVHSEC